MRRPHVRDEKNFNIYVLPVITHKHFYKQQHTCLAHVSSHMILIVLKYSMAPSCRDWEKMKKGMKYREFHVVPNLKKKMKNTISKNDHLKFNKTLNQDFCDVLPTQCRPLL